jgi:hypothetical protein
MREATRNEIIRRYNSGEGKEGGSTAAKPSKSAQSLFPARAAHLIAFQDEQILPYIFCLRGRFPFGFLAFDGL